ncbi:MAG: rod shape-determining protein MreC [Holophagales bacterium]|nr:rod shape-determining protein MreC [Holophagales bacterium]
MAPGRLVGPRSRDDRVPRDGPLGERAVLDALQPPGRERGPEDPDHEPAGPAPRPARGAPRAGPARQAPRRRPVAPGGDPPRADRRRRDRRTLPDRAPGPGPRRRHRPGRAVVGEAGLLGRVVAAGERGARVQLLSDRTAATGILLTRTSRAAVARGDGASGANLQYVPAIADVAVDDEVTSSGTDGIYPRGLLVGRIGAVRRPGSSLFLELPVTLAADPMNETLVFVFPPVKPDAPAPASGAPLPARPSP